MANKSIAVIEWKWAKPKKLKHLGLTLAELQPYLDSLYPPRYRNGAKINPSTIRSK